MASPSNPCPPWNEPVWLFSWSVAGGGRSACGVSVQEAAARTAVETELLAHGGIGQVQQCAPGVNGLFEYGREVGHARLVHGAVEWAAP